MSKIKIPLHRLLGYAPGNLLVVEQEPDEQFSIYDSVVIRLDQEVELAIDEELCKQLELTRENIRECS